jgi:predicted transcriptional regulator
LERWLRTLSGNRFPILAIRPSIEGDAMSVAVLESSETLDDAITRLNVLMSFHEEWAQAILDGYKRVEFRRRRPNFPPGTIVWMYVTAPRKAVRGWFEVGRVIEVDVQDPKLDVLAMGAETPESLAPYFGGLERGYGIEVVRRGGMTRDVRVPGNRGPMSYRFIYPDRALDGPFLRQLRSSAGEERTDVSL